MTHPSPDPGRACFVGVAIADIQSEDYVLSPLATCILDKLHLHRPESGVDMSQRLHALVSVENKGCQVLGLIDKKQQARNLIRSACPTTSKFILPKNLHKNPFH